MGRINTTIKDIAKQLGISTSTVSRALSDRWDVSPQTRELVINKAKELKYRPNLIAKRLQSRRSKTIGIVVPELVNSYFPRVIMVIQEVLNEHGFSVLITRSNESEDIELNNLKLLEDNFVEGIIISITSKGDNAKYYQHLINNEIPLVFFNRVCNMVDAPKVTINDREMAYKATKHLVKQGYKRIAHFGGPADLSLTKLRMNGYLDALDEFGIDIDKSLIVSAGIESEQGYDTMKYLISMNNIPDAIFAFNDPVALGAMRAIKGHKLKIPDDIALVGFSESRSALLVEPRLTSVEQPIVEIGKTAAKLILQQIKQLNDPYAKLPRKKRHEQIVLDAKMNVRESSIKSKQ